MMLAVTRLSLAESQTPLKSNITVASRLYKHTGSSSSPLNARNSIFRWLFVAFDRYRCRLSASTLLLHAPVQLLGLCLLQQLRETSPLPSVNKTFLPSRKN